jgi:hypothetical protein
MANKTDEELLVYIEQRQKYNPNAVFAAIDELNKRGKTLTQVEIEKINADIEDQKQKNITRVKEAQLEMTTNKDSWWRRNYQNRLLILGLMLTGFGIYQLPTIFTFKSNLIQIKGTLRSADTYVKTVTDRLGHNSQKSELIFYINGRHQKYYFVENIGNEYSDDKYENILKGLKRADSVSVWVRKSEMNEYIPKVFQIDADQATLLDFETVRTDGSFVTLFMLILGLGAITVFFALRFPNKLRKLL